MTRARPARAPRARRRLRASPAARAALAARALLAVRGALAAGAMLVATSFRAECGETIGAVRGAATSTECREGREGIAAERSEGREGIGAERSEPSAVNGDDSASDQRSEGGGEERSERLAERPGAPRDERSREWLRVVAEHGCAECHGGLDADQRALLDARSAPRLAGEHAVGERVHRAWLEAFLADPRGTRPGTAHPHQLAGLAERERADVAADLAAFLSAGAEPRTAPAHASAAELEAGRRLFHSIGCVACHAPQEPHDDLAWSLADWNRFESEDEAGSAAGSDEGSVAGSDERNDAGSSVGGAEDVGSLVEGSSDGGSLAEGSLDAADARAAFVLPGTLPPGEQPIPPDLARKYSLESLAAFLADPLAVRPSGHMPDMALGAAGARAVAAYLLRAEIATADGRLVEYPGLMLTAETLPREARVTTVDPADLPAPIASERRAVSRIHIDDRPVEERFVLRYEGILTAPADGEYTLRLASDDGSWLDVDGVRVIDHGGDHSTSAKDVRLTLAAGAHTLSLVMYEHMGDQAIALDWSGPGFDMQALPEGALSHYELELAGLSTEPADPARPGDAVRGAAAFASFGCATCHRDVAHDAILGGARPAGAEPPCVTYVGGAPDEGRFRLPARLAPSTRATDAAGPATGEPSAAAASHALPSLAAAVAALEASPEARVEHALAGRSCLHCHRRGEAGGVHPARRAYFEGEANAELGDEGRYPPHLTGVGRKLNDEGLLAALEAHARVRPFTRTRMPRFGLANVGALAKDLAAADRVPGEAEAPASLPPNAVQHGRRLAGIEDGLGCVQCHDFLGSPSLGVRAVDLGNVHSRIRWPWFRELLLDPSAVNMNTRMTAVFVEGESPVAGVYGGDPELQVAALWAFLAEGPRMAPPPGIRTGDEAYELEPLDGVRMIGVFMRDVSPKVLCVGTPAGVHFAWDMQGSRLAKVWRGRFINARGTWEGRAGAREEPPARDVLDLPPGPAVLLGVAPDAPWDASAAGAAVRRTLVEGLPEFTWRLGAFEVEERIRPAAHDERAASIARTVTVRRAASDGGAGGERGATPSVLLASGARIRALGAGPDGAWSVEGATPYVVARLSPDLGADPGVVTIVELDDHAELRWSPARGAAGAEECWTVSWRIEW